MTPKKSRLSPGVWTVLCLLLALCLWEWAAAAGHVNDYFFSRPSALWAEFLELVSSCLLAKHLSVTLQEAGLGLLFGGLFGTLAGLGLGLAPRVSRALTPLLTGLNGLPNELKLKYLADNDLKHLSGKELEDAVREAIRKKSREDNKRVMASMGTTPRRLTDLIGSLCDLTSGSGDKGTPIILVQGYFNNYAD